MSRRRSAASQLNDERLLDAAAAEMVAVGVDRVAMRAVAARAGLTTGALYSRYENAAELAAAVWTTRVRDHHHELLDIAVHSLIERDRSVPFDRVLAELRAPSPDTLLALEFLGTARRIDELEEVVLGDVHSWLTGWHAGPRSRDRLRRAQVGFTLASIWGSVLHEIPSPQERDWTYVTKSLRWAFARTAPEPTDSLVPDRVGPVSADTGNAAQDALIDSVASIVARVGFERASATRIARRAGLTAGSIYARYRTKDELLRHAVEILLARRFSDDLAANQHTFSATDVGGETGRVVGGYLAAPRREWRHFRIESQLAARHRPELAATLDAVQEAAIREYLDLLGARDDEERAALDSIARFAQVVPLGLAFVDLVVPGVPALDWRLVLRPLLNRDF